MIAASAAPGAARDRHSQVGVRTGTRPPRCMLLCLASLRPAFPALRLTLAGFTSFCTAVSCTRSRQAGSRVRLQLMLDGFGLFCTLPALQTGLSLRTRTAYRWLWFVSHRRLSSLTVRASVCPGSLEQDDGDRRTRPGPLEVHRTYVSPAMPIIAVSGPLSTTQVTAMITVWFGPSTWTSVRPTARAVAAAPARGGPVCRLTRCRRVAMVREEHEEQRPMVRSARAGEPQSQLVHECGAADVACVPRAARM
jgi:hypothetical protein